MCWENKYNLKDVKIMKRFEENVTELLDVGAPILWRHIKDGALVACDDVCWENRGGSKGDTWWWNEEVKEVVTRKKEAHAEMCQNSAEKNKRRYKSMKNKANEENSFNSYEREGWKGAYWIIILPKWDVLASKKIDDL